MALMNAKKFAIYLSPNGTLPVPPAGYFEVEEPQPVNPDVTVDTFKRVSSKLGNMDSYVDTNQNMFSVAVSHVMRSSNAAGDALATPPTYGRFLQICGFDETIGVDTVVYTNSQTPTRGSALFYLDGKKQTMTDRVVGDFTLTATAGQKAIISGNIQGYADNGGVPVDEVPADTDLSDEGVVGMTTIDVVTVGGTTLKADQVVISTNPEITNVYATGAKQHDIDDYDLTLEVSYFVDSANYADAINALNAQTLAAVDIKLNTNNGTLVDGKSVQITADIAKPRTYSDSIDQNKVKRTFTYGLQLNSSDVALSIKHGNFI